MASCIAARSVVLMMHARLPLRLVADQDSVPVLSYRTKLRLAVAESLPADYARITLAASTTRLNLQAASEDEPLLNADLPRRAAAAFEPGDKLSFRVQPERVRVFPSEP
jgi:hypothetical protein